MEIGFLSDEEMLFLKTSLENNGGMSELEYTKLKIRHPYAIMRDDNALILSSMKHYGLHDEKLNNFLISKFGKSYFKLDFFYELIYNVGDYTNPHLDKEISIQTTLLLLDDKFTGGELLINDKNVSFDKKNMYINFEGYKDRHSVTKILSGQRRVLVVMFNKKQNIF